MGSKRLHIMAAISGGSGPHQQHPGGLGASKKAARKESPDPPPRELILASPDLRLNSKLSWSSLTTYFDCLGPKRMFVSTKRTSMAEHFGLLFLIVGLCLFIAFIIWIMFFMKVHEEIEEALEDGGEIYIITGANENNIKNQDILLERPRSRFPWHLQ